MMPSPPHTVSNGEDSDPNQCAYHHPHTPPRSSWVAEHPGAVLTIAGMLWAAAHWASTQWIHQSQAPALDGIRRDIRTLATHQLEAQRSNRNILRKLAAERGIEYTEPPELNEAEVESRKLRSR